MTSPRDKRNVVVASAVALLVIASTLVIRISGRTGVTDPHVQVETRYKGVGKADEMGRLNRYISVERVMSGEVSLTAGRLQEAMMISTASALLVACELANGRAPQSSDQLIEALFNRHLLPTGIVREGAPGTLKSSYAKLRIRYRTAPLSIEVLSLANGEKSGPTILIKLPNDERMSESGIWLREANDVVIPQPFAPPAELIAMGYLPDSLPNLK